KRRLLVRGADHDPAADGEAVEHLSHRLRGVAFCTGLIRTPEPACATERSALGHPGIALALAHRAGTFAAFAHRFGDRLDHVRHDASCTRSAAAWSTSSITELTAASPSELSITGVPWRSARATMS